MVTFPNCKINLGLNIIEKRNDGFHNLETVFLPVPLTDILEIITEPAENNTPVEFISTGLQIEGDIENNICLKAYHLLKKDFPEIPSVKMHLHKIIPMGAGLGGGSANGAFALKMLNDKYNLSISTSQLINYALQLGSDCPFFIFNKPCFATSRGENLEPIDLNLSLYDLVIVNPGIHINTGWAFKQLQPAYPQKSIYNIIQQPVETWKDELKNDFEFPVFKEYPIIAAIKDSMYQQGAVYASMTGSGSTVFGIFEKNVRFTETYNYFINRINL